jgi:hypothetical protein
MREYEALHLLFPQSLSYDFTSICMLNRRSEASIYTQWPKDS